MKKYLAPIILLVAIQFSLDVHAQNNSGHFYTSFDGAKIYYEVSGSGYPVILIHGFMNTAENMKRDTVYKALLDAGYKVILLDMRGNGRSDKPHNDEGYANDAEAKDIMGLATSLHL